MVMWVLPLYTVLPWGGFARPRPPKKIAVQRLENMASEPGCTPACRLNSVGSTVQLRNTAGDAAVPYAGRLRVEICCGALCIVGLPCAWLMRGLSPPQLRNSSQRIRHSAHIFLEVRQSVNERKPKLEKGWIS